MIEKHNMYAGSLCHLCVTSSKSEWDANISSDDIAARRLKVKGHVLPVSLKPIQYNVKPASQMRPAIHARCLVAIFLKDGLLKSRRISDNTAMKANAGSNIVGRISDKNPVVSCAAALATTINVSLGSKGYCSVISLIN